MELDERIIEGKRPLTCLDVEQAKEFVGKECIFSDNYENFKHIDKYTSFNSYYTAILALEDKAHNGDYVFKNAKNAIRYRLILPCEWVKEPEKTYRPYKNVQELFEDIGVDIGDTIHFKSKAKETESHSLITSYTTLKDGTEKICLGGAFYYTMQALFELFELHSRGEWMPFGIEE